MFDVIKPISRRAKKMFRNGSHGSTSSILNKLSRSLRDELEHRLDDLSLSTDEFPVTHAFHLTVDNLSNTVEEISQLTRCKIPVIATDVLEQIDDLIRKTTDVLRSHPVECSQDARDIATRTLNLLFCARQALKQDFGLTTHIDLEGEVRLFPVPEPALPVLQIAGPGKKRMILDSGLLHQLHQALLPAEKMIVGAGRRSGAKISIGAIFDVTGAASACGVKADPERLSRALIAMSATGSYLALWVHSHPGSGPGMTHPSSIDTRQHATWLQNYSADLVSAIVVDDRFFRFWGTAVENGDVQVEIDGPGVQTVSAEDNIYRIEG